MPALQLSCQCGSVKGTIQNASAEKGNHLVCYCKDCQAFPTKLGCADKVLNAFGGTEIYQTAAKAIAITQGAEHIRCLKLSEKGLHRWYANCCNTPIANTLNAAVPFVGIIHSFFADQQAVDGVVGPVLGSVHIGGATGAIPEQLKGRAGHRALVFRVLRKLLIWKLTGQGKPSPFYDDKGQPISKPTVVSNDTPA